MRKQSFTLDKVAQRPKSGTQEIWLRNEVLESNFERLPKLKDLLDPRLRPSGLVEDDSLCLRFAGFSLVELLVALAILAVMAAATTYTYQEWRSYADSESRLTQLTSAIAVTESYGLSFGRAVTLCKTKTGEGCDGSSWSQGLLVFFDDGNQHQVRSARDRIKVLLSTGSQGTLAYYGFPSSNYWQYQPKVSQFQQNGTFIYCDNRPRHRDWRLVINKTGRYKVEKVRDERCL